MQIVTETMRECIMCTHQSRQLAKDRQKSVTAGVVEAGATFSPCCHATDHLAPAPNEVGGKKRECKRRQRELFGVDRSRRSRSIRPIRLRLITRGSIVGLAMPFVALRHSIVVRSSMMDVGHRAHRQGCALCKWGERVITLHFVPPVSSLPR